MKRFYCNYEYQLKDQDGNIAGTVPKGNCCPIIVSVNGHTYKRVSPPDTESDDIIIITFPSSMGRKSYYYKK